MSKKYSVWYSTDAGGECRHNCSTGWEIRATLSDIPGMEETDERRYLRYVAQDCAEDYHSNHDGWECSWPITFTLYDSEDGPALACFEIERESEPVFYARPVSSAKGTQG
jgi:hypothetical protein